MPKLPRLQSCLYFGDVQHERLAPFLHRFQYQIFMVYLDLAELDLVFAGRWFWSTRRTSVAQFRREDHFGDPRFPLDQAVRDLIEERLGFRPEGPIRLLTHLRYFGFVMNPVSFYFSYDDAGENVLAVVAEVNNTPWGEQHCYVLDWRINSGPTLHANQQKEFHVSPFMPMGMQYRWMLQAPGEEFTVQIENHLGDERAFGARLTLHRVEISTAALAKALLWRPCMTATLFAGIYWQALKLWWKGATYYPHPTATTQPTRTTPV